MSGADIAKEKRSFQSRVSTAQSVELTADVFLISLLNYTRAHPSCQSECKGGFFPGTRTCATADGLAFVCGQQGYFEVGDIRCCYGSSALPVASCEEKTQ